MRAFLSSGVNAGEVPFAEGAAQFGTAGLVWLHLDGREQAARDWIIAQTDIPDTARSALLASETRPRCDIIVQGALINLRGLGATPEDDPDALVSTRFWAETGRVISLSYRSPLADIVVIQQFLDGKIHDPGDLLACYAESITDALDPDVAKLGDTLDTIEAKLETQGIYVMRRKVGRVRGQAIDYRRFVSPQRQALERLATSDIDWLSDDDRMHLREASDRFARMAEELEAIRERAAIVHEELTDLRAEQMDGRSLILSIAALVFLPLTFVTGLFGMNVPFPYQEEPRSFWVILAACLAISFFGIALFIHRRWIRRDGSLE